ncbi:MAG TPA: SDR family oxidoreductase [Acetobacteraceae bacterium]|jgi:NADP-dependent 3-hydroxy acid dehydrogenase YdfG|nr:SDR family oxidoreductase [Acetobacteraceae bacterium]
MAERLVVITGASSGIGLAIAKAFAREGNKLLLIARHMQPIAAFAGAEVAYAEADVADYAAVEAAVRAAEERWGGTECLVNSAGFADARDFHAVLPADFSREIDVNLKGILNCTKAVIDGMSHRKSGTIINVSSISDRKTSPVAIAYTASKYGVRGATESLREAEGKNFVRVINIAPGYVKTNIHAAMGISFEEYCALLGNPDFMSAEELAEIVLFCWKLPQSICVRDLVVAPTRTSF